MAILFTLYFLVGLLSCTQVWISRVGAPQLTESCLEGWYIYRHFTRSLRRRIFHIIRCSLWDNSRLLDLRWAVMIRVSTLTIFWHSGVRRFSKDIKSMLGFEIVIWWKFCWGFVAPFFIMVRHDWPSLTTITHNLHSVHYILRTHEFRTASIWRLHISCVGQCLRPLHRGLVGLVHTGDGGLANNHHSRHL